MPIIFIDLKPSQVGHLAGEAYGNLDKEMIAETWQELCYLEKNAQALKKMNKHLVFQSLRAPKTNYAATAMEIDYQAFDESHALGIKYSNLLLSVS